ncbi:MAG: methylenetetrahydrofolate reductase [Lachnospiraceae bacterium]|nr:methylenetetrahydrofolate reductase [Lachnospiraceae bacterium]
MKIIDTLKSHPITISMEVFPPKSDVKFESVRESVRAISRLHPSFVSCTYGAGGGTSRYTVEIAQDIMQEGVPSMAHLTCISSTKDSVHEQIMKIKAAGIDNILALRGDIPAGMDFPSPRYYEHAIQLVEQIRTEYPDACIGGACYPEKHPDALNKDEDIRHIKEKVDAGCDFLTTQMFFNNSIYYNYLYRLREAGVTVPILAGIMPVTSRRQMERSIQLSGCVIPPELTALADRFGDSPAAMQQAGILYASHQIIDLIANGCGHIHVYTMNKPEVAAGILDNLKGII